MEIFLSHPDGSEKQLAILKTSQLVGEAALLTKSKRNASARASTDTKLLILERPLLNKLMKLNSEFAESVIGFMLNRTIPARLPVIKEHIRKTKDGQVLVILENTLTDDFYQLNEYTLFLWRQLDGTQSIRELTIAYFKKFKIFAPELICDLMYSLNEAGFVHLPTISNEYDELEKEHTRFEKIVFLLRNFTSFKFSLKTDVFLTKSYQKMMWLFFTLPAYLLFILIAVGGFIILFKSYPQILQLAQMSKPNILLFFLLMIPVSTITVFAHEAGHAYTAKKFGYKVSNIGVGWYVVAPIAFTDTALVWVADKKTRIAVDIAGVCVDLVFGGVFAILAMTLNHSFSVYLWFCSLFIYFNALKNLSPIKEYDGYYLLNDILDTHQLRKLSLSFLVKELPHLIKQPLNLKAHKDAIFYWLACFIYLVLFICFFYFILKSLFIMFVLTNYMKVHASLISAVLVLIILFFSIKGFAKDIKRFALLQAK